MSDEFTIERLEAAFDKAAGVTLKDVQSFVIAELTKPEWCPHEGQYYIHALGKCVSHLLVNGRPSDNARPLTTKEAGPECMAHLKYALERLAEERRFCPTSHDYAKMVLETHAELIK